MNGSDLIAAGAALSAFSGESQHNRLMRLEFPFRDGPPAILLPNKLVAHEEVSKGFRFDVEVLSDESRIPLKMLMGKMVTISIVRSDGSLRYFNGHITEFRFLRTDGGFAIYSMDIARQLGRSDTMKVEHEDTVAKAMRGKTKMPITAQALAERGIKALIGSMWSGAAQPRSAADYEETYIHAKVAIVDDAAFTVGSANLNVRSMALDSELNLLSQAMDVAFDLRQKLFKQCTNDAGPAQFGDMGETFKKWLTLMEKNTEAMANGWPLKGQIATFHVDRQPGPPVI